MTGKYPLSWHKLIRSGAPGLEMNNEMIWESPVEETAKYVNWKMSTNDSKILDESYFTHKFIPNDIERINMLPMYQHSLCWLECYRWFPFIIFKQIYLTHR